MRAKISTGIALAVALCALGALSAPAFAKEKIQFGEFEASITGQNLETTPGVLKINKEGEIDIEGLELGSYIFGPINRTTGEQETGSPCKSIKIVNSTVNKEKSSELTFKLKFTKCAALAESGTVVQEVPTSFTLGFNLKSNFSAEVGKASALEIEPGTVVFKGALKKCVVSIPRQTIPANDNLEKEFEEIVEYENESEAPEGIEHSKKLKELYPSGEKEFLNIVFGEKFKHIRTYTNQTGPCTNRKGTGNGKIVEEGEHKGELEFTNGHMFGEILLLEIKNGNLKFKEAP
jgi:hypothetical protein